MKYFFSALITWLSMVSNFAFAEELSPVELVKIENYQFEFQQTGSGKAPEATGAETEGISYHSVFLSYKLKQDDIVESPTLLASIVEKAEKKCKEVAGTEFEGEIISKIHAVSPWLVAGKYICALK